MKQLKLPASKLSSQLNGFSLRNAHTNIYADGKTHTLTTTILDQPVTLRITPVSYLFKYGDGTSRKTTTPGAATPTNDLDHPTATSHQYTRTGKYSIGLTTTYTGEFSVNGGPFQAIPGTATVESTPLQLQIWRTRHLIVGKPCTAGSTAPGCNGPMHTPAR